MMADRWDMQVLLTSVIKRHLPCPEKGLTAEFRALCIIHDLEHPTGQYPTWGKRVELQNLAEIRRGLRAAQRAWNRLHPDVRDGIVEEAAALTKLFWSEVPSLPLPTATPSTVAEAMPIIADLAKKNLDIAELIVKDGHPKGKAGWREIGVVATCRDIWKGRTGSDAPSRGLDEASPFGLFLKDVFKACELKFSRGRFDAWVKVQNLE